MPRAKRAEEDEDAPTEWGLEDYKEALRLSENRVAVQEREIARLYIELAEQAELADPATTGTQAAA